MNKKLLLFLLPLLFWQLQGLKAQHSVIQKLGLPTQISDFHGFEQHDFIFRDRSCKIVLPKRAADGNPWIWRARFWGHEPQTDVALLERGFHVVYCDVAGLFGAPQAVGLWNAFYDLMQQTGLGPKASLEAMSRGGLIAYNWAAENPEKVACIYADAPVLDIRSWPGGLGGGPGSEPAWERCKQVWGLQTKKDVRKFKGNPMDKVKPIVRGGYPLLHICGDADEVVPIGENTNRFEKKVLARGGRITVIRKPGVKHHPHSLEDPAVIVDFILKAQ